MTKTPIANDEPADPPSFWVQVLFTGVGVVPIQAINCADLSDVFLLLHREDPLDQYFDGFTENRQPTRVYLRGTAMVTARSSIAPVKRTIIGAH